jgi:ABC-type transport system involved in multi-copper enzyme maturation permease subunit
MRHLWIRAGYLAVLMFVMLVMVLANPQSGASLADLAKSWTQIFKLVAMIQLGMMCFLAPIFTATAITQEKDSQTYNILLTTPLSNAQIVLGSLMSRLYFVVVLLLAGLPIFCVMMLYGGVTLREIFLSFGIAGSTAVLTGSLAIALSVIKVGTRRTIFSFYLVIALYLLILYAVAQTSWVVPEGMPGGDGASRVGWFTAIHPFLALQVALNQVPAPPLEDVSRYGWPWAQMLALPQYTYMVMTMVISMVLVTASVFFVRQGQNEGEATLLNRITDKFRREPVDELRRKPRNVWQNPVAWREAATRASAASQSFMRYVFALGGTAIGIWLLVKYLGQGDPAANGVMVSEYRSWLKSLVYIEYATILLVVTNVAATSMTREREADTMDLLLCTPLTSRYIVWGKLRGLVSFAVPFIAVPVLTVGLFAVADLVRGVRQPLVFIESVVELGAMLVAFAAFAAMLGLQASLKSSKTTQAVIVSVGTLALVCLALWACGIGLASADPDFGAIVTPLTPFTAISVIIDPDTTLKLERGVRSVRPLVFFGSLCSVALYVLIVAGLYKNMVRNFDMTVRKQLV